MTTCTVGNRNVSDVQFPHCLRSRLAGSFTTEVFSQGAAAELLCSIPSPVTMCRYSCYVWLYYVQARVSKCLQGMLAACSTRPLISTSYQHLLLMFSPCTFLHLVAFAEQNTDYFSIFINTSRGAEAELFGASDVETQIGMFSHASVTGGGFSKSPVIR